MSDEIVIVFNPENCPIEDYKKKYPELDVIPEFKHIRPRELVWIFYYSNPTSYMVYQYPEKKDRALQAGLKAFGNAVSGNTFAESFLSRKLPNQTKVEEAIKRMEKILPTVRYQAKEMVNKCFNDMKELLDKPLSEFKSKSGELDINSYMAVRRSVLKELEEMVRITEIGFGISSKEEKRIDGQSAVENYLKNKI